MSTLKMRQSPVVIVPVLSKTKVSMPETDSNAEKSLTRIPSREASEIPVTRARGMAIPRAQGQDITITVTARTRACSEESPKAIPIKAVPIASNMISGTNHLRAISVFPSKGVFCPKAFSIMRII